MDYPDDQCLTRFTMGQALRMRRVINQYKTLHVGFWIDPGAIPPSTFACPIGSTAGRPVSSTYAPPPGPPPGSDTPEPQPNPELPDGCNCDSPSYYADGWCDASNNNESCCYDGGDCCESTCLEHVELNGPKEYTCGQNGYDCLDPSTGGDGGGGDDSGDPDDETVTGDQTVEPTSAPSSVDEQPSPMTPPPNGEFDESSCEAAGGQLSYLDDMYCDDRNNVPECWYDYGDCCSASCGSLSPDYENYLYDCGIDSAYNCLDPAYVNGGQPATTSPLTTADAVIDPTNIPITSTIDGDIVLGNGPAECTDGTAAGFSCLRVSLMSFAPYPSLIRNDAAPSATTDIDLTEEYPPDCKINCCDSCFDGITKLMNDMWGYTDQATGLDLVVVGATDRTVIIDVTDGERPILVGLVPQLATDRVDIWKDVKVYREHVFICSEATGFGIQSLSLRKVAAQRQQDIQTSANSTEDTAGKTFRTYLPETRLTEVSTAHNLVVNDDIPVLYIASSDRCRGLARVPFVYGSDGPRFGVGAIRDAPCRYGQNSNEVHDAECLVYDGPDTRYTGHEICFMLTGEGRSLAIYSWTTSILLGEAGYPGAEYSHQGWLSTDKTHFFLGDELDSGRTRTMVFNVSNLQNPQLHSTYVSPHTFADHNMYMVQNMLFQANYAGGLRVLHYRPQAENVLVEVGHFDTSEATGTSMDDGAWSVYPFFEDNGVYSGKVVVSGHEGVHVLQLSSNLMALMDHEWSPPGGTDSPDLSAFPSAEPTILGDQGCNSDELEVAWTGTDGFATTSHADGWSQTTHSFVGDPPQLTVSVVVAEPLLACEPIQTSSLGQTGAVVVERGNCTFFTKVRHARDAGFTVVVIVNNKADIVIMTCGSTSDCASVSDMTVIKVANDTGFELMKMAAAPNTTKLAVRCEQPSVTTVPAQSPAPTQSGTPVSAPSNSDGYLPGVTSTTTEQPSTSAPVSTPATVTTTSPSTSSQPSAPVSAPSASTPSPTQSPAQWPVQWPSSFGGNPTGVPTDYYNNPAEEEPEFRCPEVGCSAVDTIGVVPATTENTFEPATSGWGLFAADPFVPGDDDVIKTAMLPFSVKWGCELMNHIHVSVNGYILFSNGPMHPQRGLTNWNPDRGINNLLAVNWVDLVMASGKEPAAASSIKGKKVGGLDPHVLVSWEGMVLYSDWNNVDLESFPERYSFQARLYPSGKFKIDWAGNWFCPGFEVWDNGNVPTIMADNDCGTWFKGAPGVPAVPLRSGASVIPIAKDDFFNDFVDALSSPLDATDAAPWLVITNESLGVCDSMCDGVCTFGVGGDGLTGDCSAEDNIELFTLRGLGRRVPTSIGEVGPAKPVTSLDSCASLCLDAIEPFCVGFNFNNQTRSCHMYLDMVVNGTSQPPSTIPVISTDSQYMLLWGYYETKPECMSGPIMIAPGAPSGGGDGNGTDDTVETPPITVPNTPASTGAPSKLPSSPPSPPPTNSPTSDSCGADKALLELEIDSLREEVRSLTESLQGESGREAAGTCNDLLAGMGLAKLGLRGRRLAPTKTEPVDSHKSVILVATEGADEKPEPDTQARLKELSSSVASGRDITMTRPEAAPKVGKAARIVHPRTGAAKGQARHTSRKGQAAKNEKRAKSAHRNRRS